MLRVAGRIHWLTIAALAGIVLMVVVLMSGGNDAQSRASIFMSALSRGDAKVLAESTYVKGKSKEEILAGWEKTVEDAKYFQFKYQLMGIQTTGESAIVRMEVWRDISPGGYPEPFQLDLTKADGDWKVRGNGLNREMYPFLPRF